MINTALVSFGMSGKVFHAPFLASNPNFNLVGSWERSTKNIILHIQKVHYLLANM